MNSFGAAAQLRAGGPLGPISPRRRRTDKLMRGVLALGTVIALVPLALIIYYLLKKGVGAWSTGFFKTDPNGNFLGYPGGVKSAILGSLEMIGVASVIAIPVGIGVALYLTEYGKASRYANVVRYFIDVMTGVPSIVFGLFIYITLVAVSGGGFGGLKGALALSLLMLPVVARSAEVVLLLVPDTLRESALALGAPRWRVVLNVILPTAVTGLVTGALLAVARAAGETAPLLFTAFGAQQTNFNLSQPMNSLPVQIFGDLQSPRNAVVDRAWGAALALVMIVLLLSLLARLFNRSPRIAGTVAIVIAGLATIFYDESLYGGLILALLTIPLYRPVTGWLRPRLRRQSA